MHILNTRFSERSPKDLPKKIILANIATLPGRLGDIDHTKTIAPPVRSLSLSWYGRSVDVVVDVVVILVIVVQEEISSVLPPVCGIYPAAFD